ncbi:MAG: DNA-binding response regulator [Archangium gephyra]|uniref:DNA-binding response regulator n=1 Tax=Archangium gephyra TaxID=48 RepID=A0A2W5VTE9_9BACT|nr:MAG: DNA-binding response regulator [Archangium gephyra]
MAFVLIVDDESDLASLVEFNLQQAGLETAIALTGERALQLAHTRVPDVVLLDLMLPDISGKEVCRRLRADLRTREVPIVMLTARGEETDRVEGFEVGADDYVSKPFSPRELVLRIKAILRRSGPAEATHRINAGLLSLDTGSHRAWVDGQPLELTALEFKLLHQFMSRPGRVQSREQLLADVWGITSPLETRTVDTHVMRLREKLGPARNSVETVRGVGYRMTDESAAAAHA